MLLRCLSANPQTPLPTRLPEVVWRRGIDLDPVDVHNTNATRWLEALVWPGEGDRLARLRAALQVARQQRPQVVQRDLRDALQPVVAGVPVSATLVVFHSAVLAYVPANERAAFVEQVRKLGAVWIANEAAAVLPEVQQQIGDDELAAHQGNFLLSWNGTPVAWTDPHGEWISWR